MTTDTAVYMPRWKKVLWLLIMMAMTVLFLWLFAIKWPLWWTGIQTGAPVIMFYTTAGYLLGGCLFLIVVEASTIISLWAGPALTDQWRRAEKGLFMASALSTFLLPWLGNPLIVSYLENHGYTECPAMSEHNFRFSRIAYVRDSLDCIEPTVNLRPKANRRPKDHAGAATGRQIP